jgi:hypothetical protein
MGKFDFNNQMITLSVITLSGVSGYNWLEYNVLDSNN